MSIMILRSWQPPVLRAETSSALRVDGFRSSEALDKLSQRFASLSETEQREQMRKINTVFELHVTNDDAREAVWTVDVKHACRVYRGPANPPPDITLSMSDHTFCGLAEGRVNGRKAFFSGELRAWGNPLLAPKFGSVFKNVFETPKL